MKLKEPPTGTARSLQEKVDFDERIVGYKLHSTAGEQKQELYTLEDVAAFLHFDSIEKLRQTGGKGTIGYIDLEILEEWVREVHGDDELGDAIAKIVEQEDSYQDQMKRVKRVIKRRLEQAKEVT